MTRDERRAYDRERKRRLRLDPAYCERVRVRERERRKRPEVRHLLEAKNARQRERWANDKEYRDRRNKRRAQNKRHQASDEAFRDLMRGWQADYFARHYGDESWRQRRDKHRVKGYYGVNDPALIEALVLSRAAKRKMRASGDD